MLSSYDSAVKYYYGVLSSTRVLLKVLQREEPSGQAMLPDTIPQFVRIDKLHTEYKHIAEDQPYTKTTLA